VEDCATKGREGAYIANGHTWEGDVGFSKGVKGCRGHADAAQGMLRLFRITLSGIMGGFVSNTALLKGVVLSSPFTSRCGASTNWALTTC
jgi:hypothetical protein